MSSSSAGGAPASGALASQRSRRLLVVGNVNVDVLMGDLAPWPQPGTEALVERYELRVGGAAGNTALALAALGASAEHGAANGATPAGSQGAVSGALLNTDVIATVGDDALGRWLEAELGHVTRLTRVPVATALTVGLTHPDGQRTFVSYMGHLSELPLQRIDAAIEAAAPGDLLFLCGYFLMPGLRHQAPALLRRARAKGVLTALDTGWPPEGWTSAVRGELLDLMPHLSVFLPNREELLGVVAEPDPGAYEPGVVRRAVARLAASGLERVVVKLGAAGAMHAGPEGEQLVAAPQVRVQDTVGAGDTFNAGLLAAVQRGQSWREALAPAVQAASLAIASAPRRYPSWAEVSVAVGAG